MKKQLLIHSSPVTDRRVTAGDIGELSEEGCFIRVRGQWYDFSDKWESTPLPGGFFIAGKELDGSDIGRKVLYIPTHADSDPGHEDTETGTLMHWNQAGAMINYTRNKCRTDFKDLIFI